MLGELHHHGYRLSPGTLYPMLARMARRGWLRAAEPKRSNAARIYRLTRRGHDVLEQVRRALDELYAEVAAPRPPARAKSPKRRHKRPHTRVRALHPTLASR